MSEEEFIEDNKNLIFWVIKNKFDGYLRLKDDLISFGYIGLWKAYKHLNSTYSNNEAKAYIYNCVYHEMLDFVNDELKKQKNNISMQVQQKNNKYTLEDLLGKDDKLEEYLALKDLIENILSMTNERDYKIIKEWLNGESQKNLKLKYKLSKQSISLIINTFKTKLKKILNDKGE